MRGALGAVMEGEGEDDGKFEDSQRRANSRPGVAAWAGAIALGVFFLAQVSGCASVRTRIAGGPFAKLTARALVTYLKGAEVLCPVNPWAAAHFSHITPCATAPITTDWSDSFRARLAPAGRPCLCTAHRKWYWG